jgi:FixJ family two-component response regulator
METEAPTVFVVDDDAGVLKALARLIGAAGYRVQPHEDVAAFLRVLRPDTPGCILLDLSMPAFGGLAVQEWLNRQGFAQPVVFLTGRGDIAASVLAMKAGASDFLTKPAREAELLAAIDVALDKDRRARAGRAELAAILARVASLTPREREVLTHVVAGRLNKQIAAALGTAEKTVKVHRHRVMEKMQVRSLADLVRLAARAGFAPAVGAPAGS